MTLLLRNRGRQFDTSGIPQFTAPFSLSLALKCRGFLFLDRDLRSELLRRKLVFDLRTVPTHRSLFLRQPNVRCHWLFSLLSGRRRITSLSLLTVSPCKSNLLYKYRRLLSSRWGLWSFASSSYGEKTESYHYILSPKWGGEKIVRERFFPTWQMCCSKRCWWCLASTKRWRMLQQMRV